jgi:hypothetical protein
VRRRLHRQPDIAVGQDALIVAQADIFHFPVGPVGAEVRERQVDRPDQREDVDRQKEEDRRSDEHPGNGPVTQAADFARNSWRRRFGSALYRGL